MDGAAEHPWTRRDAELALTRERERYAVISVNLFDLADDPTCRLLAGASLGGATQEAWATAEAALNSAWAHLGAYQEALTEAEAIFRERPRPGSAQLSRLQRLLSQSAIPQVAVEIPPAERAAAGPATATRTTSLAQLSAAMEADYKQVASIVGAVAKVWQAVDAHAGPIAADLALTVEEDWHERADAAGPLRERLRAIRASARSDPLALHPGWPAPGPVDTAQFEELRRDLDRLRSEIEELRQLREHSGERLKQLRAQLDLLEAAESGAAARRRHALSRVVADLPAPPRAATVLRRRFAAAEELHRQRSWTALGTELGDLETRVAAAGTVAREAGERASALLAERDRLRGRLSGYQARARRLGVIEEPAISLLFQKIEAQLWTAPCDLRAAAGAVELFRQNIEDHTDDDTGGFS